MLTVWGESGPAVRHLELGDTSYQTDLTSVVANLRGLYSSLGLSLSELRTFWGHSGDVGVKALGLARDLGCSVVVHADRWSLAVHRSDADLVVRRLMCREPAGFGASGTRCTKLGRGACQLCEL